MASAAQMLANQSNAQNSTGPRTEEGKARSRFNSVAHGLTSKQLVLPHESQEEFDELRSSLVRDLAPANALETAMAERVFETYWRMKRFTRVETAFLTNRMDAIGEAHPEMTDGDEALARLFTDPAEMARTRLMLRYLTAAERAYNKALADLTRVQAERRKNEAVAAQQQRRNALKETWVAMQKEAPRSAPMPLPKPPARANGFASQRAAAAAPASPPCSVL